jgi:hypothetical protein
MLELQVVKLKLCFRGATNTVRIRARLPTFLIHARTWRNLTTLAFWLRSSVVSVLHRLTSMIGAPPLLFGYLIFAALALELCLQLGGTMTLPLHCRLASSGDPLFWGLFLPFTPSFRALRSGRHSAT